MKRTNRAAIAQQTLEILERGTYQAPGGALVDLRAELARAIDGSRLYGDQELEAILREQLSLAGTRRTVLEVSEETSAAAIRRLVVEHGLDTLCLNFASAKHAGAVFWVALRRRKRASRARRGCTLRSSVSAATTTPTGPRPALSTPST